MASVAASGAAVASARGSARGDARGTQDAATAAWLCAIPCAAVAVVAILVLGPPLGHLLYPAHNPYVFLPGAGRPAPEPTEQTRYLIALCAPLLGALAIATASRWRTRIPAGAVVPGVIAPQLALAAVVVASIAVQYRLRYGAVYTRGLEPPLTLHYFTPPTLAVAVLLAAASAAALRSALARERAAAALRGESRRRMLLLGALAALVTAVWMLHAVHSDAEIGNMVDDVRYHLEFTLDETFAVINGRTPLVNFTAQYGSLSPYVLAVPMLLLGKTVLTFTIACCTLSGLALLGVYGVLRRAAGSATAALALYLPFLATSLYQVSGTFQSRSTVGSYYAAFPLRYVMPFLVAWLTARRIERGRGSGAGAWPLFAVGGIALLNNSDFGAAALGATLAALLWSAPPRTRRELTRLGGALAAGLATAVALLCALTLVRAGALPQPSRLVDYARIYAIGGFSLMPIRSVLGVHLLVYLTYVAALVVATARAARGAASRVLTGMLAWAGVFGLGAGTYWVGRSHPVALKYQFSAWALALALLAIVAIRELAAPRLRTTAIGALVALFGFGVAACSLAQTPTPWEQLQRLQAPFVPTEREPDPNPLAPSPDPAVRRFVSSLADGPHRFVVRRGAPVAILLTTGHRIADAYDLVNVSPYTGASLETADRVLAVIDALRAAGGNTVILPDPLDASILPILARHGFDLLTPTGLRPYVAGRTRPYALPWPGGIAVIKFVDMRHLHPRALAGGP